MDIYHNNFDLRYLEIIIATSFMSDCRHWFLILIENKNTHWLKITYAYNKKHSFFVENQRVTFMFLQALVENCNLKSEFAKYFLQIYLFDQDYEESYTLIVKLRC